MDLAVPTASRVTCTGYQGVMSVHEMASLVRSQALMVADRHTGAGRPVSRGSRAAGHTIRSLTATIALRLSGTSSLCDRIGGGLGKYGLQSLGSGRMGTASSGARAGMDAMEERLFQKPGWMQSERHPGSMNCDAANVMRTRMAPVAIAKCGHHGELTSAYITKKV
jgi:hypothetical protein